MCDFGDVCLFSTFPFKQHFKNNKHEGGNGSSFPLGETTFDCVSYYFQVQLLLGVLQQGEVKYRIEFKMSLLFVFKSLHNLAPLYLTELLQHRTLSRSLRSTNSDLLRVPRTRLKTREDRAFSVVGPKLWNSLPFFFLSLLLYFNLHIVCVVL